MISEDVNSSRTGGNGIRRWTVLASLVTVILTGMISGIFLTGNALEAPKPVAPVAAPPAPQPPRRLAYGIDITDCRVITKRIKARQNLSDILTDQGVGYGAIMDLARKAVGVFDVRSLHPNRPYSLIVPTALDARTPSYFIYEISQEEYVVFSLETPRRVTLGRKPVTNTLRAIGGTIDASLWQSVVEHGGDPALISELSDIFAWSVDLHHLRDGDTYRVIFEEKRIDNRYIGIGRILAAVIRQGSEDHFAFYFDGGNQSGYFDEDGGSLEKAFLKAPVRYCRISSRFSRKRFHPVLKTVRAHLGTDYAAPVGTPVMSTADGTVMTAGYDQNNGNYIKIRHNGTYTTQYLHLSRVAKGIRSGTSVKQGRVIGYVGKSGMATGPHLCYRFWKNGRQVDPLTTPLPATQHLPPDELPTFRKTISTIMAQLAGSAGALTLANKN